MLSTAAQSMQKLRCQKEDFRRMRRIEFRHFCLPAQLRGHILFLMMFDCSDMPEGCF